MKLQRFYQPLKLLLCGYLIVMTYLREFQPLRKYFQLVRTEMAFNSGELRSILEPVHIKIASKIIAKVRFPKYRTSSLS